MSSKQRMMLFSYYLPGIFALIRVGVTVWFLMSNPMGLPLRFLQVIVLVVYGIFTFTYFKLYSDGVPVISIVTPSLVHAVLIFAFKRVVVVAPFVVLLLLDIAYLVVKSVKANLFPFDIEGDDEDDVFDLEELSENAE